MPSWLARTEVPLFVARQRMPKRLPRALGEWALDSGGFSELSRPPHRWGITPAEYVALVRRCRDEIGGLRWAAAMDHMCEPFILSLTGSTVAEHQARTVTNYLELRDLAPELPIVPVVQGFTLDEYLRCVDLYAAHGIDLADLPLVGLGSVCRRQSTVEAERIVRRLHSEGLRLHGFGVKVSGLARYGHLLASADSLAWSFAARVRVRDGRAPSCDPTRRKSCANCLHFALSWRDDLIGGVPCIAA